MQEQIYHPIYAPSTMDKADGVAWVATSKDSPLVMYPFTFMEPEQNEVRLKILHTSICHSDIATIRQDWGPCNYPCCPGHQVIGEITLIGSNVTIVKVGDVVGVSPVRYSDGKCEYCLQGDTQLCENRQFLYGTYFGGYCSHLQIDQNWVFPIPQGMNIQKMVPLLCAGVTTFAPIKRYQKVGGSCAVIAIGGLGHLAAQYANKLGMQVTAFTTKTNNLQELRKLGVQHVQSSIDVNSLKENQGKYDLVINTLFINDQQIYKAYQRLTAPGGTYVMLGLPNYTMEFQLDTEYIIQNQITVAGSLVGSINDVKEMLDFSHKHNIECYTEHYSFDKFNEALYRAEKERPIFRVVVNVTDWAKQNGFDKSFIYTHISRNFFNFFSKLQFLHKKRSSINSFCIKQSEFTIVKFRNYIFLNFDNCFEQNRILFDFFQNCFKLIKRKLFTNRKK